MNKIKSLLTLENVSAIGIAIVLLFLCSFFVSLIVGYLLWLSKSEANKNEWPHPLIKGKNGRLHVDILSSKTELFDKLITLIDMASNHEDLMGIYDLSDQFLARFGPCEMYLELDDAVLTKLVDLSDHNLI